MDTRKVGNSIEKEVDNARSKFNETAGDVLETGRDAWKDLRERSKKIWQRTRQQSGEGLDEAEGMIKEYPIRAVGIALLAGAVIGLLIAHRSED